MDVSSYQMEKALEQVTIAPADGGASSHRAEAHIDRTSAAKHKWWWPGVACCCLYVLLAIVEFGHVGSLGPGHMYGIGSIDAIVQIWWLAWAAFAFPHVHSMFLSQWQNVPVGQNFGVNGSVLAVGTMFAPITKLFGPVVTWNVLVRLSPAISAASMCFVLRRWTTWWPSAFIGGVIYGFSSYAFFYAGYIFLVFVALPPVALLLLHEIFVRQRWRPGRTGSALAIVLAVQFFVWTEILASTILMGTIAVCCTHWPTVTT